MSRIVSLVVCQDLTIYSGSASIRKQLHSKLVRRTIALSPSSILLLKQHKERQRLKRAMLGLTQTDNDLVFSTLEGNPIRHNTITRNWTVLAARYGLKHIRLHDARHTHTSLMLKQGIHPKIVQERLEHATISVTLDTHSHVAPGLQEAAAVGFDNMTNSIRTEDSIKG